MSGNSTPVILLHGGSAGRTPWLDTARSWKAIADGLESGGRRCVSVDRPGHGGHPAGSLDDLTFGHECEFVARTIRDGGGSAHLVAHAEAGITALLLARRAAQEEGGIRVVSCTIVGGNGAEPTGDAPERVVLQYPPAERWSPPSQRWAVRRLSYRGDTFGDPYDSREAAATSRAAAEIIAAPGAASRLAGDLLRAKGEIFAHARDVSYDVPISLIWGMSDPLSESSRAVELMNLLSSTTAHLELNLVDRAGHFVHRERPAEFLRLFEGFLEGVEG